MSWSAWGIPGLLGGPIAFALAVLVFRAAPARRLNRELAVLLLLEGAFMGLLFGVMFVVEEKSAARAVSILGIAAWILVPYQYLRFLGASLDTALVRPFRSRISSFVLALLALGTVGSMLIAPESFLGQPYDPGWADWNIQVQHLGVTYTQFHGVVSVFALVAAIVAYRHAPMGSAARDRAKWFAIAFGFRDAYIGATYVLYSAMRPVPFWGDFIYNPGAGIAQLLYVLLLSYGVLRAHLFDIDLKIKLALERSTVISLIAAAFFVGSELLEAVVPVEGALLGIIFAGLIVIALRPIQRVVERLVSALMPGVRASPEYIDARKMAIYSAAVEGALDDGFVTEKESAILTRLRSQLEITVSEAEVIEQAVARRLGSEA